MPIGLCTDSVRECDERARNLLGSRYDSVFRTPVEAAIEMKRAEGPHEDRRPAASERNEELSGSGIPVQAWNIADEAVELDDFVAQRGLDLDGPVREAHPELAFMAFIGQPVAYSKTGWRGERLRAALLAQEGAAVDAAALADRLDGVEADDVRDAAALAVAGAEDLTSVPPGPGEDQPRIYFPPREPAWEGQSYFSG